MKKTSPLPWEQYHEWVILDKTGRTVAECVGQLDLEERKENAAFIVRAVNAHKELLELLKDARSYGKTETAWKIWEKLADKAIAKAEGR